MLKFILIMTGLTLMACTNRSQDRNDAHLGHADRIVGGTVSSPTDPWAASTVAIVNFPEPGAQARSFCTGTLIAEDLVITAAHCLRAQPWIYSTVSVFFGTELPEDPKDPNLVPVEKKLPNPNYRPSTPGQSNIEYRGNDVGLIKLASPAPQFARPAGVLAPGVVLPKGTSLLLAGWGIIDDSVVTRSINLRSTEVPLADYDSHFLFWITDQTRSGACAGDSGGPAFVKARDQLVVIGATRGPKGAQGNCHHFGEFSDLSTFRDFILEGAGELNARAPQFIDPTTAQ